MDRRVEGVAGAQVARLQALPEPVLPLSGGSVGEGIGRHPALRLLLQGVVADGAGRAQGLVDVALFQDLHGGVGAIGPQARSEEHTSELQSPMRISYAVFCLKKKNIIYSVITMHL